MLNREPPHKLHKHLIFIAFSLAGAATIASAQQPTPCHKLNIPSLSAATAIQRLARETGANLVYSHEHLKDRLTQPVRGCFTVPKAIDKILEDTGLISLAAKNGAFAILKGQDDE